MLALALAASSGAGAAPSPADRQATDAYLQAKYALTQALVEQVPASQAAIRSFAETLGHECAGVLAGARRERTLGRLRPGHLPTPREEGESTRRRQQLDAIRTEYTSALIDALYAPDAAASTTFTQTVAPLRWSNPRIAPLIGSGDGALQELTAAPSPATVCADLRSWQQSGYRTLPTGTLEVEAHQEALARDAEASESLSSLLAPYERAPEKRLARRTTLLQRRFSDALESFETANRQLVRALGLEAEERPGEHKGATVIGKGETQSGGHYKLSVEPRESESSCGLEVSTEYEPPRRAGSSGTIAWASTSCLSARAGRVHASVQCERGDGLLEVEARLPPATRRVLLRLSDGRTVDSPAAIVPARLGGPVALYFQVLNGPTPYPISLTALSATGVSLRTLELEPVRHCKAEPPQRDVGPKFVTLAHGTTATGVPFNVVGVLVTFGRHQHSFNLEVDVNPTSPQLSQGSSSSSSSSIEFVGKPSPDELARIRDGRIFTPMLSDVCPPHEFAIVYGLLAKPGESVLVRTASGLTPLQLEAIPANLKAGGELAYGSFATIPSEVIVRGSGGRTLFSDSLEQQAHEHAEYCRGYEAG